MGTQTTGGGSTTSLDNTVQAQIDSFGETEDFNSIDYFDVMSNDLGGNAKILWSLDDTASDGSGDLISSDIGAVEATSSDTSANGAKIWICNGKVAYDASTLSSTFRAALQALAVGETLTDSFTYAIRLSNGTLAWTTATIVYTGQNDAPDISVGSGDSASATLAETNATLSSSGTLTVVDPDTSDTVAVSITNFSKSGTAGSLTDSDLQEMLSLTESSLAANAGDAHNLHWSFASTPQTFDYLAAGESLTLTWTITASDGHGGSDTQTVTVTVTGTNDGPAIVAGGTLNGGVVEESGTYAASGSFGFTDVDSSDTHSVSVTPGASGYLGTLTPTVSDDSTGDGSGTVSWSYSVPDADLQFLAEGETRTQTYTVTVNDGHGGTASQTVTIVLTGDEDPVTITSAAQSKSISEDGTSVGGTISFNDVDLIDTHTASFVANAGNTTTLGTFAIDASVTEAANAANGSLGWSYNVDNSAAQYLAAGETVVEKYDVTFDDGHGSTVTETVTITITGSNDGPDIAADTGDSASGDLDETDSALTASGTLTVTDPDTSDTVDTTVTNLAISGNQGSLTSDDLGAMFSITSGGADLAANIGDANNLGWSFDSGSEAFNFLAEGETLTLTYTLTSDDGHGGTDTQDVTITITGSNDAAMITGDTSGSVTEDTGPNPITGNLNSTDVDGVDDSWNAVTTATASANGYGTYTIDATGNWVYTLDNTNTAVNNLNNGGTLSDSFTVTTADGTSQIVNITIHGADDVIVVTPPATFTGTGDPNDNDTAGPVAGGTVTSTTSSGTEFWNGTNGSDTINAGNGTDTIYGHDGNDNLNGENGSDVSLYGQMGDDTITGGPGADQIYGGSGNDTLYGFQPPATDQTNDAGDTIYGGSGNDTIYGQGANDTIYGGYGADTLTGGAGDDAFVYLSVLDTNDIITDYMSSGSDHIDVTAIDANSGVSGNQSFGWGGEDPTAYSMWFSYDAGTNTTVLYADTDGNASTAELMITLQNFGGFTGFTTHGSPPPDLLL